MSDQYDYTFKAQDECLTLQSFFLDAPPQIDNVIYNASRDTIQSMTKSKSGEDAPPPAYENAICVTGLASRDPCNADEHEKFWLAPRHAGCDGFLEIDPERFDVDQYVDYTDQQRAIQNGKSYCRHQGQIEGMELFDAPFFNIQPNDAYGMDPEQRLVLETGWQAMAHAGYQKKVLQRDAAHMGVFVGISSSDWRDACKIPTENGVPETFIANRFSYAINLKGPSFIVNTACSASLVACHSAKLLLLYPIDKLEGCVVAGISMNTSPQTWVG